MDLVKIKELLEKYYAGETSLQEENELQTFFSKDIVPDDLKIEQVKFRFFKKAKSEQTELNITSDSLDGMSDNSANRGSGFGKIQRYLSGIAATLLLLSGIYYAYNYQVDDHTVEEVSYGTYDNPEEAYAEARRALLLVSTKLNKGTTEMTKISKFHEVQEKLTAKSDADFDMK